MSEPICVYSFTGRHLADPEGYDSRSTYNLSLCGQSYDSEWWMVEQQRRSAIRLDTAERRIRRLQESRICAHCAVKQGGAT